jgi:hypothetical protein
MNLRDLPHDACRVLKAIQAPPRLLAHLRLVHDAAANLVERLFDRWPDLPVNPTEVLFGAATHDIGKVLHPRELSGPGIQHEVDGPPLLEQHGIPRELARFARTHGAWHQDEALAMEDLLIALADTCWKGCRNEQLDLLVSARVADTLKIDKWEAFLTLDEILTSIAEEGERRLAWQAQFPCE